MWQPYNNIINGRLWLIFRDFPHDGAAGGFHLQQVEAAGERGYVHLRPIGIHLHPQAFPACDIIQEEVPDCAQSLLSARS